MFRATSAITTSGMYSGHRIRSGKRRLEQACSGRCARAARQGTHAWNQQTNFSPIARAGSVRNRVWL